MTPMDRGEYAPEEFARYLAEQRAQMEKAGAFIHYAHSRTGLLARLSLGFVVVQAAVGFASRSATIYFLQPVILDVVLALLRLAPDIPGQQA